MIGNKLEQSIIGVFQEDLSSTFSINQVSKLLKKSYPIINKKSNFFISEEILKKINVGRSYQCFLNIRNEKTRILMSINEVNKRESLIQKDKFIENIVDEIYQLSKKFSIVTVLLNKKNIIFVMPDTHDKTRILETTTLTKDYILSFYDNSTFKEKFIQDIELQKYHVALYNVDLYLNIISEVFEDILSKKLLGISIKQETITKKLSEKIGVKK